MLRKSPTLRPLGRLVAADRNDLTEISEITCLTRSFSGGPAGGIRGQRLSRSPGHRLRHSCSAAVARKHRTPALREHGGNGRWPLRHHLDVRTLSGGHFNPVVSFVDAAFGGISWRVGCLLRARAGCRMRRWGDRREHYVLEGRIRDLDQAQGDRGPFRVGGCRYRRTAPGDIALSTIGRSWTAPAAVGAYIGAAYFFTSSTSFANPAITVGRMLSNTFAGIAPSSAPLFVGAQLLGAILAFVLIRALYPGVTSAQAADVVVPHLGSPINSNSAADRQSRSMHSGKSSTPNR